MKFYPLKFNPIFKKRIWGGQKLREFFGKELPVSEKIGESWELADLPEDKSVICNGELTGKNLHEVINEYPGQIMGDENFSGDFPILIKFLDAQDILSVQVHPDPETCRRMCKGEAKSECWYIISAGEDAVIYKGQKKDVTKEKFAEAIKKGNVAGLLNKVKVRAGECHYLPAGTTHAIGGGLLIAEIQMPSDTTYRVFDWNRVDDTGKARQLHIEEALESIHFGDRIDNLPITKVGRLVDCEYFTVDKGHQRENCQALVTPGAMKILIFMSGSGGFVDTKQSGIGFKAGDTIVVPAVYEGVIFFGEDTEYLTVIPKGKDG